MNIPPWAILKFKPIAITPAALISAAPTMVMRGLSFDNDPCDSMSGQVLFSSDLDADPLAIAWHWVEWAPGVLCIDDPCAVMSNASVMNQHGQVVPWSLQVAHLNALVYQIPWQSTILQRARAIHELPIAA